MSEKHLRHVDTMCGSKVAKHAIKLNTKKNNAQHEEKKESITATHPHQLQTDPRKSLQTIFRNELKDRIQNATQYGDIQKRRMIRHKQTRSITTTIMTTAILFQASKISVDLGITVRQTQINSTPDLPRVIELGSIRIEFREGIAQKSCNVHGQDPEGEGSGYDEEVVEAGEIDYFGARLFCRVVFVFGEGEKGGDLGGS